jgi:hypothetical protein
MIFSLVYFLFATENPKPREIMKFLLTLCAAACASHSLSHTHERAPHMCTAAISVQSATTAALGLELPPLPAASPANATRRHPAPASPPWSTPPP